MLWCEGIALETTDYCHLKEEPKIQPSGLSYIVIIFA